MTHGLMIPKNVHLTIEKGVTMPDGTLSWRANNAKGVPTGYLLQWAKGGMLLPPLTIPQTAAQDAAGYSSKASETGADISPGDNLTVTIRAISSVNPALDSGPALPTPSSVIVPATILAQPTDIMLTAE